MVVAFYALGTGFPFFYRFLYVLLLVVGIGFSWAWLSLRGIDVSVLRTAHRGRVGEYLEGEVTITNLNWLPKSWLEVAEATGPSAAGSGRGLSLLKNQARSWKIRTYLTKRGVYRGGNVQVVSQDPFGLFRLQRNFLDGHTYVVYPATEDLPNLSPRFAALPSDSRVTRHWEQITTDVASIREYQPGDGLRRIHWPYSARMNTLMVKEFDIGLTAEAWVVLDMHGAGHYNTGADNLENTEELAVTTAASILERLMELSLPVGLASNADQHHIHRPGVGPEHLGRVMESLSEVRALGQRSLPEFLYDVQPNLSRFNTLTVITPSVDPAWVSTLIDVRRRGVDVAVVMVDPAAFGGPSVEPVLKAASAGLVPTYVVRQADKLDDALSQPTNQLLAPLAERRSAQRAGSR